MSFPIYDEPILDEPQKVDYDCAIIMLLGVVLVIAYNLATWICDLIERREVREKATQTDQEIPIVDSSDPLIEVSPELYRKYTYKCKDPCLSPCGNCRRKKYFVSKPPPTRTKTANDCESPCCVNPSEELHYCTAFEGFWCDKCEYFYSENDYDSHHCW